MSLDLRPCDAKLQRAREHRLALANELEGFFTGGLGHRVSFDEEQSMFFVHALLEDDRAYRWATLVGDIVHNLRSSLDHLVHQLVIANGKEPASSNQFPICDTESGYDREVTQKKRLIGVATHDAARVRETQPFVRAGRYRGTAPPRIQPLAQLRDLSNRDKHRLLLPVRLLAREFRFAVDAEDAEYVETWTADDPIGHGDVLLTMRVRTTGPHPSWEPQLRIGGYLAIQANGLPANDKAVIDLIEMLERAVVDVLALFRRDYRHVFRAG
jgi:hypothetical protein